MKALKALEKPLGFFLYLLKALKKNRWEISPKPLETLEKAVGFFPFPVERAEKSRWENSSYLHRRKLTYLRFRLGVCNQASVTLIKNMKFSSPTEQRLFVAKQRRRKKFNQIVKKITVVWTKSDLKNEKRKSAKRPETTQRVTNETGILALWLRTTMRFRKLYFPFNVNII